MHNQLKYNWLRCRHYTGLFLLFIHLQSLLRTHYQHTQTYVMYFGRAIVNYYFG